MNNAKIWLVVSPNVGVPLFLGAVAVSSFAVHVAVLNTTGWVSDYHKGRPLGSGEGMASIAPLASEQLEAATASYVTPLEGDAQEITVVLPDGTTARAVLLPPDQMASASAPLIPSR